MIQVSTPLSAETVREMGKAECMDDADAEGYTIWKESLLRTPAVVEETESTPPEAIQASNDHLEKVPLVDRGRGRGSTESCVEGKAVDDEAVELLPKR